MLKLLVHIYLYEIQAKKHEQKSSGRQAKYQSLDDTTFASSPKKISALALGSLYKGNGTVTQSSSTKNNHKKVTSIGLIRNSRHSTQKERFKLSCLDILNFFCLMLLMFLSINTMKVSSKHQAALANCTSLKICYSKRLWFPFFLSTQQRPRVKCQSYQTTTIWDLSTNQSAKVYIKLEDVHVKGVES